MLLAAFRKVEKDAHPRKYTWCKQSQVIKVSLIAFKKWRFAFQQSLFCSPLERNETKTVVQKLLFFFSKAAL